jgi:hypothetical protein
MIAEHGDCKEGVTAMIATAGFKGIATSEPIRADAELKRLVDRGSDVLVDILGESAPLVEVQWDVVQDDRGRRIELSLSDWSGTVMAHLVPKDFVDPLVLKLRLSALWRKLLRAQSVIRVREMREAIQRLDALEAGED